MRYAAKKANNENVYHTDLDCPRLSETYREVSKRNSSHMKECRYCQGYRPNCETRDMSIYNAAVQAGKE